MVDIARPSQARKKRIRRILYISAASVVVLGISYGVSRLKPAAPTVDRAVVFAVNHPNALIDPLFLLSFAPRPVSFLAKAPLFRMPLVGRVARAFDSIPVYRRQDKVSTAGNRAPPPGRRFPPRARFSPALASRS